MEGIYFTSDHGGYFTPRKPRTICVLQVQS